MAPVGVFKAGQAALTPPPLAYFLNSWDCTGLEKNVGFFRKKSFVF